MVATTSKVIQMPGTPHRFVGVLDRLNAEGRILGFYIEFCSKTMDKARAHFPD